MISIRRTGSQFRSQAADFYHVERASSIRKHGAEPAGVMTILIPRTAVVLATGRKATQQYIAAWSLRHEMRVRYFGRGLMKDSLTPGWLIRVLNKIF